MLLGGPNISGRPRILIVGPRNPEHELLSKSASAARWEITLAETPALAGLLERDRFDFVLGSDTEELELCRRVQPLAVRVRMLAKDTGFPVRPGASRCFPLP